MSTRKRGGRRRIVFEMEAPVGSEVHVAGTFNGWRETAKPMVDKNGTGRFRAVCMVPKGEHEYKFIVDGKWQIDPANPNIQQNALGTLNSVLFVQ